MQQILDDGRVTDSQGRIVGFKNAVLIMTSNLGSGSMLESMGATDRSEIEASRVRRKPAPALATKTAACLSYCNTEHQAEDPDA
jgi:ATP-dependent Clp protease ATP-binding subunit ClpA